MYKYILELKYGIQIYDLIENSTLCKCVLIEK